MRSVSTFIHPHIGWRKIKSIIAIFVGFCFWQILRLFMPGLEVHPIFIYIYGMIFIAWIINVQILPYPPKPGTLSYIIMEWKLVRKRKKAHLIEKLSVNGKTYKIHELLGKGKGGYSYLVSDGKKEYVLKQIHHEPCDYYQFGDKIASEIDAYNHLKTLGIRMPELIDVDIENERILKEYIAGDTILEMVKQDKMKMIYMDQIHAMCKVLYRAHTNIDYFPTNFIVQNDELYYIDFECNDYMEEWDFEHWGVKYWTKTPEFMEYINNFKEEASEMV